jgi:hypothetical protein
VIGIVIKGTNNPKGVFSGVTRTIGGQKRSSTPTLYNIFHKAWVRRNLMMVVVMMMMMMQMQIRMFLVILDQV